MTRDEYDAWAAEHGLMFGFNAFDADLKMLLSWFAVFERYDCRAMRAATAALARRTVPIKQLRDHLQALQLELREYLALEYLTRREQRSEDLGTCSLCSGSGLVLVPHPAAVRDDQWLPLRAGTIPGYYTTAVVCSCPLGGHKLLQLDDAQDRAKSLGRRILTLREYEQHNPLWQEQKRQHAAEKVASRVAESRLSEWKRDAKSLVDRLRETA